MNSVELEVRALPRFGRFRGVHAADDLLGGKIHDETLVFGGFSNFGELFFRLEQAERAAAPNRSAIRKALKQIVFLFWLHCVFRVLLPLGFRFAHAQTRQGRLDISVWRRPFYSKVARIAKNASSNAQIMMDCPLARGGGISNVRVADCYRIEPYQKFC